MMEVGQSPKSVLLLVLAGYICERICGDSRMVCIVGVNVCTLIIKTKHYKPGTSTLM